MNPPELLHESVYDALRDAVRAIGGTKVVGPMLWGGKHPAEAGTYCADCLNPSRREKFSLTEILAILRWSREKGYHGAMNFISHDAGYAAPQPINPDIELAQLQREFVTEARRLGELSARIERLAPPQPALRSVVGG